ncbi:GNAT family N-acetyltransferase [Aquipluma nitroreducens]|uniref:GNAT family N-acetyltransferase n=1 Tax=Aquipluma nitroreducens TaxID=2010828 RepID=UPI00296EC57F|nr:GNAT family N-acetyltransferase [Aquipluma nitroreducens]
MTISNFERLVQLADEVFAVKSDPSQLDVNAEVLERLYKLHPATVSAFDDGNGPVAWVLLIPTTLDLMNRFLGKQISEKELFDLTPIEAKFDAVYLCSALVLEEFRRKGIAKQLALTAIDNMREMHQLKAVFVWAFTPEGDSAAETIANLAKLPLYKREK